MKKDKKFKRLYFDIETSPNIGFFWNVGPKVSIDHSSIIHERAIICICYKWEDESKVHYLTWNRGDDKKMLQTFIKIMNTADEVVGHNGDAYDIRWIKTRCLYHGISAFPEYHSLDTLKLSRKGFRFNSNRLDYLGKFMKVGQKADTGGFKTWRDIVLNNSSKAMAHMVKYCMEDVRLLERVHKKLIPYTKAKTHKGLATGRDACSCPHCSSISTVINRRYFKTGKIPYVAMKCNDCGSYFTISETTLNKCR